MKNQIRSLRDQWKRCRPRDFEHAPSVLLIILGVLASTFVFAAGLLLKDIPPLVIEALQSEGWTPTGLAVVALLEGVAIYLWCVGCIAKRSSEVLYRRWFR